MHFREILIGGILPSILLGAGTVLMKLSLKHGISLPVFLGITGASVLGYGSIATLLGDSKQVNLTSATYAVAMGITWSTAMFCMSYGVAVFKLPVSIVAPLSNSNALIAVLLGAFVFSEWKDLNIGKVILGTILIVAGATLVSSAYEK
jgi:uncharacterized membrane protein